MHNLLLALIIPVILGIAALVVMSCKTPAPTVQLMDGKWRPCPDTPNCVSSESDVAASRVAPFAFTGAPDKAWDRTRQAVLATGGRIQAERDGHLWATYTSRVFRFVDDLELRLEPSAGVIHVRSASRVGRSDLGVNRKRVEKLRRQMNPVRSK